MIRLDKTPVEKWVTNTQLTQFMSIGELAHKQLWDMNVHKGSKGWLHWPAEDHQRLMQQMEAIAQRFRAISDVTVVIGIGGSYLGARAALSMMQSNFASEADQMRVLFAGNQLSESYIGDLLSILDEHEVTVVVISKSGGTLEPSAAFHTLRDYLEKRYGKGAAERICAVTDPESGTLRQFAGDRGYVTLPIPRDIGGRYSVLTAVGLLPMMIAGLPVNEVMAGAADAYDELRQQTILENPAYVYAMIRHFLYLQGFAAEALVTYEPQAAHFAGWWQQLFGESQGKDGIGLFPTMLQYTTDLHSMGQYVQDARKMLLETVLDVHFTDTAHSITLPGELDEKSNYMSGKSFSELQQVAVASVIKAHTDAGVPNLLLHAEGNRPRLFGELVYFFEIACSYGGYLLGINGFDQPGVEAYKQEMRRRLV
ncbi:glucose-6-phosphate isomerase [Alicyclobacillus tolerans]|uniref:glucose-6-phosphate isomerase n=1 Tax=Alicyclobacillus tolerans TaxID=90970 RepID=UPI003B7D6AFB